MDKERSKEGGRERLGRVDEEVVVVELERKRGSDTETKKINKEQKRIKEAEL